MILYIKRGCGFCAKVLEAAERLNINFELRDIATPGIVNELIARGGKPQVPFLVDEEREAEMYESDTIVAHLEHVAAS